MNGISALEYAKAKLFGPLGISNLFWPHDPQGISMAGFGLYLLPREERNLLVDESANLGPAQGDPAQQKAGLPVPVVP
jgi:hypothetical protein